MNSISMKACLAVLAIIAAHQGGIADAEVTITLQSGQPVIVTPDADFPNVVPVATRIAEAIWKKVCSEKAYKPCNATPGYYEFHLDLTRMDGMFGCSSFIRGKRNGGNSEYFEIADLSCLPDETVILDLYQ